MSTHIRDAILGLAGLCLASYAHGVQPCPFLRVRCLLNTTARPHTDARNLRGSFNLSLPCSSFTGGENFLEDAAGLSRLSDQGPSGHLISAQEAIQFEPHKLHATLPWDGTRLLLLSFHIGQYRNLRTEDKKYLKMQGFNIVQPPQ